MHKGAALTEVFEVGGEDIVWVEMPVHSLLLGILATDEDMGVKWNNVRFAQCDGV